jgi:sec-independent protein translocase protein TatA
VIRSGSPSAFWGNPTPKEHHGPRSNPCLILGGKPSGITPDGAFDTPFTANEVLKAVEATGFLEQTHRRPLRGRLEIDSPGQITKHRKLEVTMPNIGPMEVLVVLVIALVVFGPKRLPELGRSVGRGIREFRGSVTGEESSPDKPPVVDPAPVAVPPVRGVEADVAAKSRA